MVKMNQEVSPRGANLKGIKDDVDQKPTPKSAFPLIFFISQGL